MKLLINTSNLYVGGGVQVSLSFLNEIKTILNKNEYHIFLSKAIEQQLDKNEFDSRFTFYTIEKSPARLLSRYKIIKQMSRLELDIKPDIVFSIFGPTYWTPKSKHVMGFAIPWVLEQDSVAYEELGFLNRLKMRLWVKYVSYFSKKNTSNYIIETQDGKEKLSNVLDINKKNIFVVGNTYSSLFNNPVYLEKDNKDFLILPKKENNEFRLLLISHNYPHKNLKIIRDVVPLLSQYNVKFILTISQDDFKTLFENTNQIINIGPVKQSSCPSLYSQCDAMFLPTLLEVFSASYPEAMKMEKPILTSNFSFAKDVCGEAALYFNPLDATDIANKIINLIEDSDLQKELVKKGNDRLQTFETARSRAEKYLNICEEILGN
ncbi:glycosyltransferase [Aliarcobacter skirrowii]|nr:glycosyltransferase [Aliarcobacter skirrowii]